MRKAVQTSLTQMPSYPSFPILPQPDPTTCGPTCLQAVYSYYGDRLDLHSVVEDVAQLETGGTLAVFLACHALRRGYRATIYTYNLQVFDPTWFQDTNISLVDKLQAQGKAKKHWKLRHATNGYLDFLELGGQLRFEDLTPNLIESYLADSKPILTGLSATYLYRSPREYGTEMVDDDVRGTPSGHFVVLCGYESETGTIHVADPLQPNPLSDSHIYGIAVERVICAILLGILTYDANLLIIEPNR